MNNQLISESDSVIGQAAAASGKPKNFSALRVVAAATRRKRLTAAGGDDLDHVGQVLRLVAAMRGLGLQVARQQVRRVGLDQQPVERDLAHQFAQVLAAALVADPAGDADRQAEVEVVAQFARRRP